MRSKLPIRLSCSAALVLSTAVAFAQNIASSAPVPAPPVAGGDANAGNIDLPISPSSQFILGAADVVRINVWKDVELSQTVTVGPDGFVSLPLLGDVQVAGMTADQLGKALAARLTTYIVNPRVTVSVVDIRSRQVYILGQVSKPGGFPLVAPTNVLQLIASAGGLTNYANRKGIVVLRQSKEGTKKIRFNYNNVTHGDGTQNISLQPGDTVVVP
jgi:polysaccharide export outer membrane protein